MVYLFCVCFKYLILSVLTTHDSIICESVAFFDFSERVQR